MPGSGKYTTYAPALTDAHTLLNKLFHSSDAVEVPPTQDLVGKETEARAAVIATATAKVDANGVGGLVPSDGVQAGDLGMFPNGVDLSFQGTVGLNPPNLPPDVSTVKWTKAGDPATPYFPDVSSPGPGRTEGIDKDVDPKLAVSDVKPTYPNPGTTEDTRNPIAAAPLVYKAATLGAVMKLGDSGGN